MRPPSLRPVLAAAVAILAIVGLAALATGQQKGVTPSIRQDLALFASPAAVLDGNEFTCIDITNEGALCRNSFTRSFSGGGFWPQIPDVYVFGSGMQIAGIIGPDGGPWAGDTTGVFFFDLRGSRTQGSPLTDVYQSTDPDDVANWPADARIPGESIFLDRDVGRVAISDKDTWVRYWDGESTESTPRPHPLGVAISQRSLQFNYPSGNESVIYFLADITNETGDENFQTLNEATFFAGDDALPDGGFHLETLYVNFTADLDVTPNASQNHSTAILPFDLAISYHDRFSGPAFAYPPTHFYPPFFTDAPGIVGIKYLDTPASSATGEDAGLTLWTTYTGSGVGFPAPVGPAALLRYMTGQVDPLQGDNPCNIPAAIVGPSPERSLCFQLQTSSDTRFMMASGPFELGPGETESVAVAYLVSPTLATLPDGSPTGISANAASFGENPPGVPSFHPGFPSARGCTDETATSCSQFDASNPVKAIERGAGWVSYGGPAPASPLESPEQKLDQFHIETAKHSLLDRALVAQVLFDAKFLRPAPPAPPDFYLIPGPDNVTVYWEPSSTDEIGDPFFALASDSASVLYNPNYRQFDVAGYEVWRGTSPGEMELLKVYSYTDRPYVDTTCELVGPEEDIGNPAGLGFALGETCPEDYLKIVGRFPRPAFNNGVVGGLPGRGVIRQADGRAVQVSSLPFLELPEWEAVGFRGFGDGVPFVHVDNAVTNNFTYFYSVSAFDQNSPASGPTVQRSDRLTKSVIPRTDAPNLVDAEIVLEMTGDDGAPLSPGRFGDVPEIDEETGIFAGPFPPTNAYEQTLTRLIPRLFPATELEIRIDSIVARASGNLASGTQELPPSASGHCDPVGPQGHTANPFGACWHMHLSITRDGVSRGLTVKGFDPWWSAFGVSGTFVIPVAESEIAFDAEALEAFGIPDLEEGFSLARLETSVGAAISNSAAEAAQARRFGYVHGGARWFDGSSARGAVNTFADPARGRRVGHLTGIQTLFAPVAYVDGFSGDVEFEKHCFNRALAFLDRAADIVVTWGAGNRPRVRDVTHAVNVPFSAGAGASWGFLTTDANGNGVIDWHDFNYIRGALPIVRQVDGGACNASTGGRFDASGTAVPVNLVSSAELVPTSTRGMGQILDLENGAPLAQTGTGFGLYINGHRFIFELFGMPGAGTEWTLRTYRGGVRTFGGTAEDPSGYSFDRDPGGDGVFSLLPQHVPGLRFRLASERGPLATTFPELDAIHTVPDPYFFLSRLDGGSATDKELVFVNLPPRATIRIYSLAGHLVDVVEHDDPSGGGREPWDLRNRNGQFVASAVYFWHVVTPTGEEQIGRFTVINKDRE